MKTAAVILNYNDAEASLMAARRILRFRSVSDIVLVDNASRSEERSLLSQGVRDLSEGAEDAGNRIHLVLSEKNGGYGSGNNLGVRFAMEQAGAELCLIANPDSDFPEELVLRMQEAFSLTGGLAACGAVMEGRDLGESCWPDRGFLRELLNSGPFCRRLFRRLLCYDASVLGESRLPEVFAVHGSILMVHAERFLSSGGYDEKIFLYCEENVLGKRLKERGLRTVLVPSPAYRHQGGGSIRRSAKGAVRRERLRQASELYYYRTYLGAGPLRLMAARVFQAVVLLETAIASRLGLL